MRDLGLEGTPHFMAPECLSSEVCKLAHCGMRHCFLSPSMFSAGFLLPQACLWWLAAADLHLFTGTSTMDYSVLLKYTSSCIPFHRCCPRVMCGLQE
jgi:hypothetical protein